MEKADPAFDYGCLTLCPKQVFLSRMDSGTVFDAIRQKVHSGIVLTDDDLMKLVVLPLSVPGPKRKTQLFEKISSLAGEISDETQRNFVLSAMALATEKFIDRE